MVQYIITPWRSRAELLSVRRAFYPTHLDGSILRAGATSRKTIEYGNNESEDDRRTAVARVSVWVQRGNCPHSVESTALLVSAMCNDGRGNSAYAVRAAYSAAFSRFVTGLLDGYQDKKHKMSMYAIAASIGLPATFVELRHQCTHEELPGLGRLRAAAGKAMDWIWEFYWKGLEERNEDMVERGGNVRMEECRRVVGEWVSWRVEEKVGRGVGRANGKEKSFREMLGKWSLEEVVGVLLEDVNTGLTDSATLLERVRLGRDLMSNEVQDIDVEWSLGEEAFDSGTKSVEEFRLDMERAAHDLENFQQLDAQREDMQVGDVDKDGVEDDGGGTGWEMWKGPWVPKPIGVV